MNANNLLSIITPESLFSKPDISIIKKEYHNLVKVWHPDKNPDKLANEVFQHIGTLYHQALHKVETGIWVLPSIYEFISLEGKKYRLHYKKQHSFELGEMYIGDTNILFAIPKANHIFFENAHNTISKFKFANDTMKKEMTRWLPNIKYILPSHQYDYMLIGKGQDVVLLKDLFEFFKRKSPPPEHVAWIMSSLLNICCYLDYAKLSHNCISLDTVFISPRGHSAYLYGGWWWSKRVGTKITQVPARTASLMSSQQKNNKIATQSLDLDMVRAVGRELFRDLSGAGLYQRKEIPKPVSNWMTSTTSGVAVEDYRNWRKVMEKSWGKPKFHDMKVKVEDIYA